MSILGGRSGCVAALSIVGWLAVFGPGSARAQDPAPSRADVARRLFERGKHQWEEKRCADAVTLLKASAEQLPLPGPLTLLADCYESLGQLRSAHDAFQRAAELAHRDTNADLERRNLTRAAAVEQRMPQVEFRTSKPALSGLEVSVNGIALEPRWLDTALPFDAGAYRLEAHAPGHHPLAVQFVVSNDVGQPPRVQIVPVVLEPAPPDRHLAYWFGGGAAAAFVATFAVSMIAVAEDGDGNKAHAQHLAATWGNVLGATTIALAATTGVLYFTAQPAAEAKTVGSFGVGWRGAF